MNEQPLFSTLQSQSTNTIPVQGQSNSHVIIVIGNPGVGKTSLTSSILGNSAPAQSSVGLLYSYFRTNIAGQRSILQLYEVSGQAFRHLNTLPISKLNYRSVSYTIVVDLADNPADILGNVNQQVQELRSTLEKLFQSILTPQQYQELEQKSYASIESHQDRVKIRPMLLPLTIVCWKYDLYAKNLDVEVRKWLSRGLRYIAHSNNATLAFGSQNDSSLARQAISSNQRVNQADHMKLVYVSRGMDTIENIALPMMTTQQMSPIDAIAKIIKEQVVVNPNPQKKTQGKLLSQEEWDLYKEEKIDRVKREKDNLMNADK